MKLSSHDDFGSLTGRGGVGTLLGGHGPSLAVVPIKTTARSKTRRALIRQRWGRVEEMVAAVVFGGWSGVGWGERTREDRDDDDRDDE